jgi:hypothetical protein
MAETTYQKPIAHADINGDRIERIFVKDRGQEEIRFSWWPNGRLAPRPLDLTEDELLALVQAAIAQKVFSPMFLSKLKASLP